VLSGGCIRAGFVTDGGSEDSVDAEEINWAWGTFQMSKGEDYQM